MNVSGTGAVGAPMIRVVKPEPTFAQKLAVKFVNGAIAGITGVSIVYPLDIAKTRLQNSMGGVGGQAKYTGILDCLQKIVKYEGVRGVYKGLVPNLVGITPEKAIKLAVNDLMRDHFAAREGIRSNADLPLKYGVMAGGIAGFCQVIATNPMEIVKIQLQIDTSTAKTAAGEAAPAAKKTAMQVVRQLGIRGLYRGTTATLLRDVPFSIIFFPGSAILTSHFNRIYPKYQLANVFAGSVVAGVAAAVLVTPSDVIKTRLQANSNSNSTESVSGKRMGYWGTGRMIVQNEGYMALFKGSTARAMIMAPLFGIALATYEFTQRVFFK